MSRLLARLLVPASLLLARPAWAIGANIQLSVGDGDPAETVTAIKILALLSVLTVAPAILVMMTSFTRILIVFSFIRHAMGTQTMPPNQVMVGLALFLTVFVMKPVWDRIEVEALVPYQAGETTETQALEQALVPVKQFMLRQTREKDLALFYKLTDTSHPANAGEVPATLLIPAFVISELKTAFQMGFTLFLPFLLLDMIVASILMAMGMMMLPPILISLPFKIMLFVLVDGWNLLVAGLIKSFV